MADFSPSIANVPQTAMTVQEPIREPTLTGVASDALNIFGTVVKSNQKDESVEILTRFRDEWSDLRIQADTKDWDVTTTKAKTNLLFKKYNSAYPGINFAKEVSSLTSALDYEAQVNGIKVSVMEQTMLDAGLPLPPQNASNYGELLNQSFRALEDERYAQERLQKTVEQGEMTLQLTKQPAALQEAENNNAANTIALSRNQFAMNDITNIISSGLTPQDMVTQLQGAKTLALNDFRTNYQQMGGEHKESIEKIISSTYDTVIKRAEDQADPTNLQKVLENLNSTIRIEHLLNSPDFRNLYSKAVLFSTPETFSATLDTMMKESKFLEGDYKTWVESGQGSDFIRANLQASLGLGNNLAIANPDTLNGVTTQEFRDILSGTKSIAKSFADGDLSSDDVSQLVNVVTDPNFKEVYQYEPAIQQELAKTQEAYKGFLVDFKTDVVETLTSETIEVSNYVPFIGGEYSMTVDVPLSDFVYFEMESGRIVPKKQDNIPAFLYKERQSREGTGKVMSEEQLQRLWSEVEVPTDKIRAITESLNKVVDAGAVMYDMSKEEYLNQLNEDMGLGLAKDTTPTQKTTVKNTIFEQAEFLSRQDIEDAMMEIDAMPEGPEKTALKNELTKAELGID